MNIIEILWKLGWDILSFNEEGEYKIKFTKARKDLIDKKIEAGLMGFDSSAKDVYTVKVSEVGFDRLGNLYVIFEDVEDGSCIDAYEHKNMNYDELF